MINMRIVFSHNPFRYQHSRKRSDHKLPQMPTLPVQIMAPLRNRLAEVDANVFRAFGKPGIG